MSDSCMYRLWGWKYLTPIRCLKAQSNWTGELCCWWKKTRHAPVIVCLSNIFNVTKNWWQFYEIFLKLCINQSGDIHCWQFKFIRPQRNKGLRLKRMTLGVYTPSKRATIILFARIHLLQLCRMRQSRPLASPEQPRYGWNKQKFLHGLKVWYF